MLRPTRRGTAPDFPHTPLTLRIYPINYWIGAQLAGSSDVKAWPASFSMSELGDYLQQSKQIITDLMIGGLVLGIPLAA